MTLTFSPDLLLSSWVAIVARMSRLSKNPKASDSCLMARPALGPGPDTASVILYSSSKFVFHSCKRGDILTWFLLSVSALGAQYTTAIRPHNKHVCYTSAGWPTRELQIQTSRRALTWRQYRKQGLKTKTSLQKGQLSLLSLFWYHIYATDYLVSFRKLFCHDLNILPRSAITRCRELCQQTPYRRTWGPE